MNQSENTVENLQKLAAIERRNTPIFFMAIAHLFSNGMDCYSETPKETVIQSLEEKHQAAESAGKILVMTFDYEKAIVDTAYELAGFPLFDILLYIKKYMDIYDPEACYEDEDLEDEE